MSVRSENGPVFVEVLEKTENVDGLTGFAGGQDVVVQPHRILDQGGTGFLRQVLGRQTQNELGQGVGLSRHHAAGQGLIRIRRADHSYGHRQGVRH